MEIRRKILPQFAENKERLEEIMDDAESFGYKFIELRLGNRSSYIEMICGLEEVKLNMSRAYGETVVSASGAVILKDGVVKFYPDNRSVCWGYMVDTENNRKWLAQQLSNSYVTIADKKIEEEIKELAKELGEATRKVARDKTIDAGVKGSIASALEEDNKDLRAQLEELKALLMESKKEVVKPLSGKKIKK
jgi:hypothetical protein